MAWLFEFADARSLFSLIGVMSAEFIGAEHGIGQHDTRPRHAARKPA